MTAGARQLPVLVVGAGPGGLAAAASLARRGVAYRLLERGDVAGYTWANLYDSLVLHTGRHMSVLPGLSFPRGTPLFPSRDDFVGYLHDYARRHALAVETGVDVRTLRPGNGHWRAMTASGAEMEGRAVIVATGIVANPRIPPIPGRESFGGRVLHSVEYRRPAGFGGQRVLVVGVGNSGGEIGSELAAAGAHVTVLVRSGANVVPRDIGGIPTQYLARVIRQLPGPAQRWVLGGVQRLVAARRGPPVMPPKPGSPLDTIPIIGFHLVDAIRAGRVALRLGAIAHFTPEGVAFADGSSASYDVVLLATGFSAALAPLEGVVRTDARGFAQRIDRVTSADHPTLHFVGHNYDSTGGLANIHRDAPVAAARAAGADR